MTMLDRSMSLPAEQSRILEVDLGPAARPIARFHLIKSNTSVYRLFRDKEPLMGKESAATAPQCWMLSS